MTRRPEQIRIHPRTADAFLLSHTPEVPGEREAAVRVEPAAQTPESRHAERGMEKAFLDHVLPALPDKTGVAALVIETDEEKPAPAARRQGHARCLEPCVEVFCRENGAFGGPIENGRFAILFPAEDQTAALAFARRFRESLRNRIAGTVTIGVALFPLPGFMIGQILENARKALAHASFFGPDSIVAFDAVSLNISGDRFYEAGRVEEAAREFRAGLRLNPSDANLRNSLGVCHGALGRFDLARMEFAEAMALAPGDVMPVYNAGLAALLAGKREEALALFTEAAETGKNVFEVALQTGRCLAEMGEPARALPHLQEAMARRPRNSSVHTLMGQCYGELDQFDKAIEQLKIAVRIHPADGAALSMLGWAFFRVGENSDIALLFCRKSVETEPDNALFHHRLGRILLSCGNEAEGSAEMKKAEDLGLTFPERPNITTVGNQVPRERAAETGSYPSETAGKQYDPPGGGIP